MSSVTQWIKGELLKSPKGFPKWDFQSSVTVEEGESSGEWNDFLTFSTSPAIIGVVVDYLARLLISKDFGKSFSIVEDGFEKLQEYSEIFQEHIDEVFPDVGELIRSANSKWLGRFRKFKDHRENWQELIFNSDEFVDTAIRFIAFDKFFRAEEVILPEEMKIDKASIENARVWSKRIVDFLESKDKRIICGTAITAFTQKIDSGDWDFLTTYDLVDIKSWKRERDPSTIENWVQLLVYFLLAKEADDFRFEKVENLTIFNPRTNLSYTLKVKDIPEEVIKFIKRKWGKVTRRMSRKEIERLRG